MVASLPPIIFLRHGETDWNAVGRLQGRKDIPLNDRGRVQAQRNGAAIAAAYPEISEFDFVASPLGRTRETMEIARTAMSLDPSSYALEERLVELGWGEWEGFTNEELRARSPEEMAAREADRWRHVPPGGESYELVLGRIEPWLSSLKRPTVVVSHGGVGRVLRARLLALDPTKAMGGIFTQDSAFHWHRGAETPI